MPKWRDHALRVAGTRFTTPDARSRPTTAKVGPQLAEAIISRPPVTDLLRVVPTSVFSRSMLVLVIAATGLCGMALELILIFVFQSLLGYVYSKVGLIVAMFMLGLTLGAFGAPRLIRRGARLQWRAFAGMEILLIAEAACIPWLMTGLSSGLMPWIPWGWVEALIYGAIAWTGALVGAQFALVNELLKNAAPAMPGRDTAGSGQGITAALTNAADLVGAALGGLAVGVLLLPLFGITATCFLLAALKVASLLCLLAARRVVCVVEPYGQRGEKNSVDMLA